MYGDPEVVRFIGNDLREDVESTRELLQVYIERASARPKAMGVFPLVHNASGEIVGAALIKPLLDSDGQETGDVEIGWHLARRHWGNGYATEAGRGLLEWGFVELDLSVLHAVIEEPNTASHAVALRLGMVNAGKTDAYYGRELRHCVLRRED
jgi:RimJ/RimL family protein N-acetyltransferase